MNVKKVMKKIAAITAGSIMLGATIMGATALSLSDYPEPLIKDGVFSGKIVIGQNAATMDVIGAIDIMGSLQRSAITVEEVEIPNLPGEVKLEGDVAKFQTGTDILSISEPLRYVKETFTAGDLEALDTTEFDTGSSQTDVKHYLKFGESSGVVMYASDDDDKNGDFLYFEEGTPIFEYQMEFTEGAVSDVEDGELEDFHGEILNFFGTPFTIVDTNHNSLKITMLGGEVSDVLSDGETKTYTLNDKDYEVTAVFIDSTDQTAKLSVNGVITDELDEGETDVIKGVTVGIEEVMTNQREGLVQFYLGANKLELYDSDYTDSEYDGSVKVNGKTVSNAQLIIRATDMGGDEIKLNYIKYKLNAEEDLYIGKGETLRGVLDEDEGMLVPNWDIEYHGLVESDVSLIEFNSVSDHSYKLKFENLDEDQYSIPLITNKEGVYKYGDDDDDFIFQEPVNFMPASDILVGGINNDETFISDDDYFVVSDKFDSMDNKAVTKVLRYQSIDTGDKTITFKDLAGETITANYEGTLGVDAEGVVVVSGKDHSFWIDADKNLALDLDGDDNLTINDKVNLVGLGGSIIELDITDVNLFDTNMDTATIDDTTAEVRIRTLKSDFDEAHGDEIIEIEFGSQSGNEIDLSVEQPDLVEDEENDNYARTITEYGTLVEEYSGSGINEVTVEYPLLQRNAQVFVTAGSIKQTEIDPEEGTITTEKVHPISVGAAILDVNAVVGSTPMIVVGGPCANTAAMTLLGNPAVCSEGFTPGKAIIKLFSDKNAILVAGYDAQDTLGASYVLADYMDYALEGSEVEIVTADLNSITVNVVN